MILTKEQLIEARGWFSNLKLKGDADDCRNFLDTIDSLIAERDALLKLYKHARTKQPCKDHYILLIKDLEAILTSKQPAPQAAEGERE